MDSHVKDKTVSPTVLSLTWESPYLGKTVFILRRDPASVLTDDVDDAWAPINYEEQWTHDEKGQFAVFL